MMKLKFTKAETKASFILLLMVMLLNENIFSQNVLYEEDFGMPTANTLIQNYDGWQNTTVKYLGNGTCDIRSTSASSGYGGASGGGNVMINDTNKWFQISGITTEFVTNPGTTELSNVNLYFGLRKTASENGSNFKVAYSIDSLTWIQINMDDTLPSGTGTTGWYRVKISNLPSVPNLHLRFSNAKNVDYRLDDISIVLGEEVVLETVSTPVISPSGGTYYESQQVAITTETEGATIRYTLDGSTPNEQSNIYMGQITINNTCTVKAFAQKNGMYNSEIVTKQFSIVDTNALVILPFDISTNSETQKNEIKVMDGFKNHKLGTSYSDGAVKFETKQAGQAWLIAHLDSMPDSLYFDLKGVKSGSPSSYSGILMVVSESEDGDNWSEVASYNENQIGTGTYTHIGGLSLKYKTRYIKWQLMSSLSGNTQLNNIKITKRYTVPSDDNGEVGVQTYAENLKIYPNPVTYSFMIESTEQVKQMKIYNLQGKLIKEWNDVDNNTKFDICDFPKGFYVVEICKNKNVKQSIMMVKE